MADVLGDGLVREEADLLDDVADLPPQLVGGQVADLGAQHLEAATGVGSISRLIIFSVVVLPQPDGPTRTVIPPSGMIRSRDSTAGRDDAGERLGHRLEPDGHAVRRHRIRYHQTDAATATTAKAPTRP